MKKYVIGLLLIISMILPVSFVNAQASFCYNFNKDLYVGITGWYDFAVAKSSGQDRKNYQNSLASLKKDITAVHTILTERGINTVAANAKSDKKYEVTTAQAVVELQSSLKATYPDVKVNGVIDASTRAALNTVYGCSAKIAVELTAPNNNVTLAVGQTMNIKYNVSKIPQGTTADLNISYVPVTSAGNGATVLIQKVTGVTNGANKVYAWVIPTAVAAGQYKIQLQVVDKNNPDNGLKSDISARAFKIQGESVALSVDSVGWKKGEAGKFTLSRISGSGPISISIVKWNTDTNVAEGNEVILVPSTKATGVLTIPADKTKNLAIGSYKLQARSVSAGSLLSGTSNVFSVSSPSITVVDQTTNWTVGNPATVKFTKSPAIGKVKIEAIALPTPGGPMGTSIVLIAQTPEIVVPISKEVTKNLTAGTYIIKVTSIADANVFGESHNFFVQGASMSITAPSSNWIRNTDSTFSLSKDKAIGAIKVSAVKDGVPTVLFPAITNAGTITVGAAKTKGLTAGTYTLLAETTINGNPYSVPSGSFNVVNPVIEASADATWSRGNREKITITRRDPGVGLVKVVAIPQNGTIGGNIALANDAKGPAVVIPKERTSLLIPNGNYKIEVRSKDFPEVVGSTANIQILPPAVTISNVTNPWKRGADAKFNLVKDNLVKSPVTVTAFKVDADGNITTNGVVLYASLPNEGVITVPKAKVNTLSVGKWALEARTNVAGVVRRDTTDPFDVVSANAAAAVVTAIGDAFSSLFSR